MSDRPDYTEYKNALIDCGSRLSSRLGKTMQQVADQYARNTPSIPHAPVTRIENDVLHDAIAYCNALGVDLQWFVSHAVRCAILDSIESEGLEEVKRCEHGFCINEIDADTCQHCGRHTGE